VKKKETHYKGVTLGQIQAQPNPFYRGMLFHSFVDDYRNTLVFKTKVHKKCVEVPSKLQNTFLKLVEDQILYSRLPWGEFVKFLSWVPEEEKQFNISAKTLMEWHTGLTLYFSLSPHTLLSQGILLDKPLLKLEGNTVKSWDTLLPAYAKNKVMQDHVEAMLRAFDKVLEKSP